MHAFMNVPACVHVFMYAWFCDVSCMVCACLHMDVYVHMHELLHACHVCVYV